MQDAQTRPPPPFEVSVEVNLTVLHATVHNQRGQFARDLREQDFQVHEDSIRKSIPLFRHEDTRVTVAVVVYTSSGMRPKLPEVIAIARTFARSSNQEDQVFVVQFNGNVTLALPGTIRFTSHLDQVDDVVLAAQARVQTGSWDKKVLLIISDGGDNASVHSLCDVRDIAAVSTALVYTIGIFAEDTDRNPDVLRHLARATDGEGFCPGQFSETVAICRRVGRDIRNRFTIEYLSGSEGQPVVYPSTLVRARATGGDKLFVRARAGYIVGGESRAVRDEGAR